MSNYLFFSTPSHPYTFREGARYACALRVYQSRHLALELTTLLAAVAHSEIARVLPVTAALVDVARGAVQKPVTAEETIRDGVAAALGRHTIARLKETSVRLPSIPGVLLSELTVMSPMTRGRAAATRERTREYWIPKLVWPPMRLQVLSWPIPSWWQLSNENDSNVRNWVVLVLVVGEWMLDV